MRRLLHLIPWIVLALALVVRASSSGSQTFKPEDGWSYTIYWHLK